MFSENKCTNKKNDTEIFSDSLRSYVPNQSFIPLILLTQVLEYAIVATMWIFKSTVAAIRK